ncbi:MULTISPECIES: GLPGLI family protein [unclassified Empedobacter]|uniref:GLPGLI family protein n=1 Tax=unclassified Empedobacter TaxID=2643773 RepID=UPI0025B9A132|nr:MULTISPECIES: GLPGLI family protein [unclassified Empedobacter]
MKIILNILFTLFMATLFAQSSLTIKYKYEYNWEGLPNSTRPSYLSLSDEKSLFTIDFKQKNMDLDENLIQIISKEGVSNMYKDYQKNKIYYKNNIAFKEFLTIDPISVFKWQLTNETKKVLGYECQMALMEYYGRKYQAYFTTELGFTYGGPWKFDGLPGVILEVYSLDNQFKITATDITLKNENIEIDNPYKDNMKFINFKEFQEMYKKWYKENNRIVVTPQGNEITESVPKCKIECLVD